MRNERDFRKSFRRSRHENGKRCRRYCLGWGIAACILAAVFSLCLGNIRFSPMELPGILRGDAGNVNRSILLYARLPRTLASLFAGAGLAVSGAVLQNVLANRLASPGIIGVNAGAGLGVTLCCGLGVLSGFWVSVSAFAGSLAGILLIFLFSCRFQASRTTVILSGVALNSILNAVCESLTVLDTDLAMLSIDFRVGGFSAVSFTRLLPAAGLIGMGLILLLTMCNELDVLTLGDETAQGVGLKVGRYRMLFLMLPHFVRRFTGNESGKLLPMCALSGAGFVTLCDLASRLLFAPYELPVGILMSVIGGPVFLFLLVRSKGGHGFGSS